MSWESLCWGAPDSTVLSIGGKCLVYRHQVYEDDNLLGGINAASSILSLVCGIYSAGRVQVL